MKVIRLSETSSTNSALKEMCDAVHGTIVDAASQTAGRGQRGNSWEAQPGKNLTFSILLRPDGLEAARQFAVSCVVAIAIARVLEKYLADYPEEVAIKWPNDIYVGDRKICGILIENVVNGRLLASSVAGIGINVNQRQFFSDAPNPVSLTQLTGLTYNLPELLEEICENILALFNTHINGNAIAPLFHEYKRRLWRREGFHNYREADSGHTVSARFIDVEPSGLLKLEHSDGSLHTYAFKEIAAII